MISALLILLNLLVLAACGWFIVKAMRHVLREFLGRGEGPRADWHPLTIVPLRPPAEGKGFWLLEIALLAAIFLLGLAYALGVV
ncbi:hypothetical protein [Falsiroseomonas sp.]|uniref:hypothetical protein n=1 Tax=Falsiroseomonas sp. TaxID=2870721 RepID=UPI003568D9F0